MSNTEFVAEATKAAPAATVTGLTLAGVPLSEWVLVGTLILVALQITFLLRDKVYRPWRNKRDRIK